VRLDAVGVAICVIREFLDSAMVLCHSAERALVGILRPNRNVGIHIFMPESGSMFSLITPSSPVSDRRSKNIPHQASPRGRSPTYPKAVVRSEDFPGASFFFRGGRPIVPGLRSVRLRFSSPFPVWPPPRRIDFRTRRRDLCVTKLVGNLREAVRERKRRRSGTGSIAPPSCCSRRFVWVGQKLFRMDIVHVPARRTRDRPRATWGPPIAN
jgi:hypothetical protein